MRGIWGPGPYQSQSRQTEIGQVIAQAAVAVLMLLVAGALAWLQARVLGIAFGMLLFAAGLGIAGWLIYRGGGGSPPNAMATTAAVVLFIVGLTLALWPPRSLGTLAEGRLWLVTPRPLAGLVKVASFAMPYSAVALLSTVNLAAIGISLLTALRLVVEVVFPNLLNSIRALGGRFTGLGKWWHGIRYPSDADEEDDGPESGGIPRRGTNVAG